MDLQNQCVCLPVLQKTYRSVVRVLQETYTLADTTCIQTPSHSSSMRYNLETASQPTKQWFLMSITISISSHSSSVRYNLETASQPTKQSA